MKRKLMGVLLALTLSAGAQALAADAKREKFGKLDDGRDVHAVVLQNSNGYKARIITLGAILQSLVTPDASGDKDDIVLGFDDAQSYLDNPSYFGATVGRFANRIAGASFQLEGVTYALEENESGNQLHGGPEGFDKRVWKIKKVSNGNPASVVLEYVSEDGEQGFPGTLRVRVTYSLSDENELTILHEAVTDKPTVANITNHSYFNLAGQKSERSILDHKLTLEADRYTPVDSGLIPTGEVLPVKGLAFDFTKGKKIGADIHDGGEPQLLIGKGYDHNFVLSDAEQGMRLAARLEDFVSGRVMELYSNQPAVQFYSGNFLDGAVVGKGGRIYRQADGLCLEPQTYPDAPNKAEFPSARLDPGDSYNNKIVLRFGVIETQ